MSDLQNNGRLPLGTAPPATPPIGPSDTAAEGQQHRLACLFETRATAERAAEDLTGEGIDRSAIEIIDQGGRTETETVEDRGWIWESIKRLFTGGDDTDAYYEGVNRGHTLLTVRLASAAEAERAGAILERHAPIDLDRQEEAWRRSGWSGGSGPVAPATPPLPAQDAGPLDVTAPGLDAGRGGMARLPASPGAAEPATAPAPVAAAAAGEQVIPVVEETLALGKRTVQGGRVRVHTVVVATPVKQEVRLRDEQVDVERRPVDRPIEAGAEAFRERTMELTESREEAVVGKSARVTEEVVVRKQAAERTEHVSDTVRRTEVKVDKDPPPARAAGPGRPTGTGQG